MVVGVSKQSLRIVRFICKNLFTALQPMLEFFTPLVARSDKGFDTHTDNSPVHIYIIRYKYKNQVFASLRWISKKPPKNYGGWSLETIGKNCAIYLYKYLFTALQPMLEFFTPLMAPTKGFQDPHR